MPDFSRTSIRRLAITAIAASALFAGFALAPAMLSSKSDAAEIVIAPPMGAPMSFADLIDKVSPAVVSISVRSKPDTESPAALQGINPDDLPPGFEQFFRRGLPQQPPEEQPDNMALGSGFFISETGTVVTNNHVVAGATEITVKTSAGKEYKAELIGADAPTDLAVLKLKTTDRNFAFVKFDREADLRVGDWVVAVGNPFGLEGTATAGIVSAKGRRDLASGSSYVDFIQTDAPINRGNSGGPTFDLKGRVVGVNSSIYSPSGGSVGIGFAIPSETAADVVDTLLKSGKITRGWLGVTVQPLDDDLAKSFGLAESQGAMVSNVVADGPADRAGVQQGDIILSVNGAKIADSRDLTRKVGAISVGHAAKLDVLRAGSHRTLTVKMAERPGEQQLASLGGRGGPVPAPSVAPTETKQAALGLDVRPINQTEREKLNLGPSAGGLSITRLEPNASLTRKGVRVGDVITEADGRVMRTGADLAAVVSAAQKAKRPVRLLIESRAGPRYVAAEIEAG